MQEFFKRVVESMDDQELEDFLRAGWVERNKRVQEKVKRGEYPMPTSTEMNYRINGNLFMAVKTYRERTGLDLLEAASVLDDAVWSGRVERITLPLPT